MLFDKQPKGCVHGLFTHKNCDLAGFIFMPIWSMHAFRLTSLVIIASLDVAKMTVSSMRSKLCNPFSHPSSPPLLRAASVGSIKNVNRGQLEHEPCLTPAIAVKWSLPIFPTVSEYESFMARRKVFPQPLLSKYCNILCDQQYHMLCDNPQML